MEPLDDRSYNGIYCPDCSISLAKRQAMTRPAEFGELTFTEFVCEQCFLENPFGDVPIEELEDDEPWQPC